MPHSALRHLARTASLTGLASLSQATLAAPLDLFRYADGSTNWQYVSNTSGSLLIIALSYVVIRLFLSRSQTRRYARQLEEIRGQLEERVQQRTATLDEFNQLLKESNSALEKEAKQHQQTAQQLAHSEHYLNNVLASMPLILIGVDERGAVTQWNRRAAEISGIKADQAIGANLWEIYPAITVQPGQVNQALTQAKTVTIKHSQRGQYHFDITIYPLANSAEPGVVLLIDDVTDRILAENSLVQRDKMSSMGELAAVMARDLDNPLAAVDAALAAGDAGAARARNQQARAIIANLLRFSQQRGGQRESIELPALVDNAIAEARQLLSAANGLLFSDIATTTRCADSLPAIGGYRAELEQVLLSLFRHACSALADDPQPALAVTVEQRSGALWLTLNFAGSPLSDDQQRLLFEPAYHGDGHAAASLDAGERLSFAHFIVCEQHAGNLAVTSHPEHGTTFHLRLPLAQQSIQPAE